MFLHLKTRKLHLVFFLLRKFLFLLQLAPLLHKPFIRLLHLIPLLTQARLVLLFTLETLFEPVDLLIKPVAHSFELFVLRLRIRYQNSQQFCLSFG